MGKGCGPSWKSALPAFKDRDRLMPIIITLLILTLPASADAALSSLAREYVQNNASLKAGRNRIESARQDTVLLKANKTWRLGYTPFYRTDGLQTLSPFAPVESQTMDHAFSLSKDFEWGGKLTFNKKMSHLEQDRNPRFFSDNPNLDIHSFTHEVRYQQNLGADFFGRLFYRDVTASQQRRKLVEREYQKNLQRGLLELSQTYTNARLQRSLVRLQKEARKRAKAMNVFVSQRVRDGLREKVDLYRAQSNVHLQEEQVHTAWQNLETTLEHLATNLHRKVIIKEIEYYNATTKRTLPTSDPRANNIDLHTLAQQQNILEQQLLKVGHEFFPRISLNLSYKTNAVDEKMTRTWKDGHMFVSDNQAKEVSLALNWPIGNAPQRALRSKLRAEKTTLDVQKNQLAKTLLLRSDQMKKQISHLEKNIRSSQKREKLASQIVKELNKLYRKGKSNLDQVLRAEEDLIRTQTGFIRHLAQRDRLYYSLLHLYGDLDKHLLAGETPR